MPWPRGSAPTVRTLGQRGREERPRDRPRDWPPRPPALGWELQQRLGSRSLWPTRPAMGARCSLCRTDRVPSTPAVTLFLNRVPLALWCRVVGRGRQATRCPLALRRTAAYRSMRPPPASSFPGMILVVPSTFMYSITPSRHYDTQQENVKQDEDDILRVCNRWQIYLMRSTTSSCSSWRATRASGSSQARGATGQRSPR